MTFDLLDVNKQHVLPLDAVVNTVGTNLTMIIAGHMLLGFSIGFTFQSAPKLLHQQRPQLGLQTSVHLSLHAFWVIGLLLVMVTNYFTNNILS